MAERVKTMNDTIKAELVRERVLEEVLAPTGTKSNRKEVLKVKHAYTIIMTLLDAMRNTKATKTKS